MPTIHSSQIVEVLKNLALHRFRLDDYKNEFIATIMFDETASEKSGIIKRKTCFPDTIKSLILSGPHFSVANPLFQTPKSICNTHRAYDSIDLRSLPKNYLPRTNYLPTNNTELFEQKIPKVPWETNKLTTNHYRLVHRKRLNLSQERTFQSAICPPNVAHIIGVVSTTVKDNGLLLNLAFVTSSIIFDFWVKSTGRGDFVPGSVGQIPLIDNSIVLTHARPRVLMLNCLSGFYSELWKECWNKKYQNDSWAKVDERLDNGLFRNCTSIWDIGNIFRGDFERRQALIEIDVLVAMAFKIDLDHLINIYRLQFPVLVQNDNNTWFDRTGRIVFTTSKSMTGVGFPRKKTTVDPIGWEDIKDLQSGTVSRTITDNTQPEGPIEKTITYQAPFDRCNREKDYEEVWKNFAKRFQS